MPKLLHRKKGIIMLGGGRLVVREGKVRIVEMRRDLPNQGAGARPLGLSDADASHREDTSPEDKAPEYGHAAVAAPPEGERRQRGRTSRRSASSPRASANRASGIVPLGVTREGGGRRRRGGRMAKVVPRQP